MLRTWLSRLVWFMSGIIITSCIFAYGRQKQEPDVLETSTYPDELIDVVSHSDDYHIYQKQFLYAAARLLMSYRCSMDSFRESGGWLRSPIDKNYYFVVCGSIGRIIYLHVESGKIYLDSEMLNK